MKNINKLVNLGLIFLAVAFTFSFPSASQAQNSTPHLKAAAEAISRQDFETAIRELQAAAIDDPKEGLIQLNLATLLEKTGRDSEAIKALTAARRLGLDGPSEERWGELLSKIIAKPANSPVARGLVTPSAASPDISQQAITQLVGKYRGVSQKKVKGGARYSSFLRIDSDGSGVYSCSFDRSPGTAMSIMSGFAGQISGSAKYYRFNFRLSATPEGVVSSSLANAEVQETSFNASTTAGNSQSDDTRQIQATLDQFKLTPKTIDVAVSFDGGSCSDSFNR